jgi:hypothetical protein
MVSYDRVCSTCGKVLEANGCNRCEESGPTWYTTVEEQLVNNNYNQWTNHIGKACIEGSTAQSGTINLKCEHTFSGGIDPNYPGGVSESSCSGGTYNDGTVMLTLSAGQGKNCVVVYETPCRTNTLNCTEM